jgi:hypothetical protein
MDTRHRPVHRSVSRQLTEGAIMFRSHKAASSLSAVLAVGALAAPSALARPADMIIPNTGGVSQHTTGTVDLRSPDTRDAAQGRQIVASTPVALPGIRHSSATGFDWGDAAIGAGGAMGAVLLCLGGTVALTRRRDGSTSPSKAARLAG